MSDFVTLACQGDLAIITVDNPPVNALSLPVRIGLQRCFAEAQSRDCKAIVLICAGRTFIAGADISEFGKAPANPWLPEVLTEISSAPSLKPSPEPAAPPAIPAPAPATRQARGGPCFRIAPAGS